MTQAQKRRSVIIADLSRMSRDWSRYTAADWEPLERELDAQRRRAYDNRTEVARVAKAAKQEN